jgi:hypothetical protein
MGRRRFNGWFAVWFDREGVVQRYQLPTEHDQTDMETMRRVTEVIPRVVTASEAATDYMEHTPPPSAWFRS